MEERKETFLGAASPRQRISARRKCVSFAQQKTASTEAVHPFPPRGKCRVVTIGGRKKEGKCHEVTIGGMGKG